ncbi:MAG: F0F1 ATP synthase subunit B [Gammaproteobacteria bacterium]|nr:MAG: F0F1 ATP synthase subunit B [Gammaproteobacteria bacterium]
MNINISLIGQIITFIILVWFVSRYLWGPLTQMMADRSRRIADGLAAAERGRHELERAEQRAKELLQKTKSEAAEIIALAQKRATDLVEEAKEQAKIEGEKMIEAARIEIEKETQRAKEALRHEVVNLALLAAEKILEREIDAKAHEQLLNKVVAEL